LRECDAAGVVVVAVHLARVPPERAPALYERLEAEHVARVAERLLPVDVDDRRQAGEAPVTREHRRLPRRALVALGVAQQAVDAPLRCVESRGERGSAGGREPLAERAAREVDAGEFPLGMRAEQRAV